ENAEYRILTQRASSEPQILSCAFRPAGDIRLQGCFALLRRIADLPQRCRARLFRRLTSLHVELGSSIQVEAELFCDLLFQLAFTKRCNQAPDYRHTNPSTELQHSGNGPGHGLPCLFLGFELLSSFSGERVITCATVVF